MPCRRRLYERCHRRTGIYAGAKLHAGTKHSRVEEPKRRTSESLVFVRFRGESANARMDIQTGASAPVEKWAIDMTVMNAAHLHLLFNHLPIFAVAMAALSLLYGLFTRASPHGFRIAVLMLMAGAFGGAVSYASGEDAEQIVEAFDSADQLALHDHEERAEQAAVVLFVIAALSLVLALVDYRLSGRYRGAFIAILLVALVPTTALLASAGSSGGKIQHREVREGFDPNAPAEDPAPLNL